jgi:hypothetical protein
MSKSGLFDEDSRITSVTIPASHKKVGSFSRCPNLRKVVIADGVEEIDYNTFYGCSMIEEVVITESVKKLAYVRSEVVNC